MDRLRIVVLILALAGLPALFLPFANDITPFETVLHHPPFQPGGRIWYLAAPAFLAIVIAAWVVRRFLRRKISRVEIALAYLLSSASMLPILIISIMEFPPRSFDAVDFLGKGVMAVAWILALLNVFLLVSNLRKPMAPENTAEVFLLAGYLPNAVVCLLAYSSWLQSGGILVAIACVAIITDIVLLMRRHSGNATPLVAE